SPRSTLFPYTTLFRSSWGRYAGVNLLDDPVQLGDAVAQFRMGLLLCRQILPQFLPELDVARDPMADMRDERHSVVQMLLHFGARSEEHTSELQSRGHL